jgi:hypothetical protein
MTRTKIVILSLLCTGFLTGTSLRGAGTDAGAYEVIANAFGFGVDIPGAQDASRNIREIAIDELNIDVREMTTGLDVEYRLYGPGQAHWGSARFTSACTLGASKELQHWYAEAARGKNIRKNITVTLFKSDKTPGRSYQLVDALPIAYEPCDSRTGGGTQTMSVSVERIDFAARPESPRPTAAVPDVFRVLLAGNGSVTADDAWQIANGGAPSHEEAPVMLGKIDLGDPTMDVIPHSTCTPLRLRGPMIDQRAELARWINETVNAKASARTLTVLAGGDRHVYAGAFPIRYVFPRMSVTNTTGHVMEEVRIKPIRCDLQ